MKRNTALISLMMLFCTAPAFATLTANELHTRCTDTVSNNREYNLGFCRGFIASFLDTYVLTHAVYKLQRRQKLFCLPTNGISLHTAVDVSVQYLQNNQSQGNKTARNLLFKAYMQKYPCQRTYLPRSRPGSNINRDI